MPTAVARNRDHNRVGVVPMSDTHEAFVAGLA
jgi:hypothetical protein